MTSTVPAQVSPYSFAELPFYSREEVALTNWYARTFQPSSAWRKWTSDAFGQLLQSPSAPEFRLVIKHSLETDKPDATHKLSGETISMGRSPENEIMLPAQSVTKQHARLIFENGACYLEDLGSTLGTYVANQKLTPSKRISLAAGTQFTIFPYLLTLEEHVEWVRGATVDISEPETRRASWAEFTCQSSEAFLRVPVAVHPLQINAVVDVGQAFLRRLQPGATAASVLLAVLERANQDLRFPFQFVPGSAKDFPPGTRGTVSVFSIAWSGETVAIRIFLPDALLEAMRKAHPAAGTGKSHPQLSWNIRCAAGYADLSLAETQGLEFGDIVLIEPEASWFVADERTISMPQDQATGSSPDLSALPVRLHVVLGEKEMTLADLQSLDTGAILELDHDKSGHVDIALNGKLAGTGTLVEVEGKLGVKILSWSTGRA